MGNNIPVHDFSKDDETSIPFSFQPIKGPNDYDVSIPHRHNFYEVFIFTKGGGRHEIDFNVIPIENNSLHFVSPGQIHHLAHSKGTEGFLLIFSRDFFARNEADKDILFEMPFLNNVTSHPVIQLAGKAFSEIIQLAKTIETEFLKNNSEEKQAILNNYLNIFLLKSKILFNKTDHNGAILKNTSAALIYKFRVLIEKRYKDLHLVKQYSQFLNTTPEYLNEASKKIAGKTASSLITDRITLEAKRLLLYSDLTGKEIASYLNYDDPSYFSRFFKNETGHSPKEFKELNFEKYQH